MKSRVYMVGDISTAVNTFGVFVRQTYRLKIISRIYKQQYFKLYNWQYEECIFHL